MYFDCRHFSATAVIRSTPVTIPLHTTKDDDQRSTTIESTPTGKPYLISFIAVGRPEATIVLTHDLTVLSRDLVVKAKPDFKVGHTPNGRSLRKD